MTNEPFKYSSDFIAGIKAVRCLTRLLGKLGLEVESVRAEDSSWQDYVLWKKTFGRDVPEPHNVPERFSYGWGLNFSKTYTENVWTKLKKTTRSHKSV